MRIIGIDIGGTFTDVVAYDTDSRQTLAAKSLTTRGDESAAVLDCLQQMVTEDDDIERVVHGTTIGTNAILERRGARTALLTTQGFRDLLEIGRTRRMAPNTLFDLSFKKPEPLIPRPLRFDVPERIDASGQVVTTLDEDTVRALTHVLSEHGVEAVAVCFLHSYINAKHELRVQELLKDAQSSVFVSLSHEIVPEYREFERLTTTVLNAFIGPLLDEYLGLLEQALTRKSTQTKLYVMASNGGVMPVSRARQVPVQTVLSGPAGGVTAGIDVARSRGFESLITCDMGGTSTDVCLVRAARPRITVDNMISGMPLKIPQVDMNTVGAGGGSVAWVSQEGQIHVGPRSAGSNPGPICYGRGGTEPTVTDANLVLRRLAMRRPLGGQIEPIDTHVGTAIEALADKTGVDDRYRMAAGILRIAVAKMVASIREISVSRGHDPRECVLVAFGGAGPMHGAAIADELSMTRILVPKYPGNFSAYGLLTSEIRHDFAETLLVDLEPGTMPRVTHSLEALREQAQNRLRTEGFSDDIMTFEHSLDIRYKGQAFEISIAVSPGALCASQVLTNFHKTYATLYGHANEDQEAEVVNVRLAGIAHTLVPKPGVVSADGDALIERRWVYFDEGIEDVPVYDRDRVSIDEAFKGPAIIEETGATTVVPPEWTCRRDDHDTLHLLRE